MRPSRTAFAVLLIATSLRTLAAPPPPPKTIPTLFLSDIHLNPFPNPALVAKLDSQSSVEPNALPEALPPARPLAAAQQACRSLPDTSDELFRSSLAAMKPRAASVSFVTVSGDLIAHQFIRCFTAFVLKQPPVLSESAQYLAFSDDQRKRYHEFVLKTIEYVTGQLQRTFPSTPIYYALGNNDSDCGDYDLDPNSDFLKAVAGIVGKSLPDSLSPSDRATALADFSSGGYYSVPLAAVPHTRLIVLDDIFMSAGYRTCSGNPNPQPDPGVAQKAWLVNQLAALKPNETVWIMGHIPPGEDPFSSLKTGKQVMFLKNDFTEVLTSHSSVIRLALFAHTHLDGLSHIPSEDSADPITLKLVQSISPGHGNPPTYTLAKIDSNTAALTEYTLIWATRSAAGDGPSKYTWPAAGNPLPHPNWSSTPASPR